MSVLNFMPHAVGQAPPQVLYGEISSRRPAPQSFSDPLYVVLPDWNEDIYFEVTDWVACHGSALPPAGNACLLEYDSRDNLRCTWWSGTTDFSGVTLGTFGGDVTGAASAAVVQTVLGGKVPLTAGSAAAGDLTGTYPAPTLAAGAAVKNIGFTPLSPANNLSDLANMATARENLGVFLPRYLTASQGAAIHLPNTAAYQLLCNSGTMTVGPTTEIWFVIATANLYADSANWTPVSLLAQLIVNGTGQDSTEYQAYHDTAASASNTTYTSGTSWGMYSVPANATVEVAMYARVPNGSYGGYASGGTVTGFRVA